MLGYARRFEAEIVDYANDYSTRRAVASRGSTPSGYVATTYHNSKRIPFSTCHCQR